MTRSFAFIFTATIMLTSWTVSAAATQNCFSGQEPYRMADDTVHWTMAIAPGADCIQGLRWSTMQIESVAITTPPSNGSILMVGHGFRYFTKPDSENTTDHFTLVVTGKNRHDHGSSTIDVVVGRPLGPMASSTIK